MLSAVIEEAKYAMGGSMEQGALGRGENRLGAFQVERTTMGGQ